MMRNRYPTETVLRDERRVMIRPFRSDDVDALHAFFLGLPAEWRRFAWDRIESRGLIERWADNIDYDKTLPLLAFDGPRVVADASLHRASLDLFGSPAASSGSSTLTSERPALVPCS